VTGMLIAPAWSRKCLLKCRAKFAGLPSVTTSAASILATNLAREKSAIIERTPF
jgi:hypothetical protein